MDTRDIINTPTLTPEGGEQTPSNPATTTVTIDVLVEKYGYPEQVYYGSTWAYMYSLTNTNLAPVTVNFVDRFDPQIEWYGFVYDVRNAGTAESRDFLVSQRAVTDIVTNESRVEAVIELPAATVEADGTITPSVTAYAVLVHSRPVAAGTIFPITVYNIAQYRTDWQEEYKDTNNATVQILQTQVLPVTGEWMMLLVPFGGMLLLAGVLLLLKSRRGQRITK